MTQSLPPKNLVLYADDDPDDLRLVNEAFKDYAHTVEIIVFSNGEELIQYCLELDPFQPTPCLIIIDINMPQLNGKQTLKKIREIDSLKEVPVVLFSTSTLPSEAAFARSFDAGFVTKPFDVDQIQGVIDQFIDHCTEETRKMIRQNRRNK